MTTLRNKHRFVVLTAAVFAASGCGSDADAGAPRGAGNSASTPTTAASATAPARPETITSACQLLPADLAVRILGSSRGTTLDATEQPAQDESPRRYSCLYGNDGQEVLSLITTTYPDRADTAAETIDAIAEKSRTEATRIKGVGADAVLYTDENVRVLAFVVPYRQELRLSVLSGPSAVPESQYTELAQQVVSRL